MAGSSEPVTHRFNGKTYNLMFPPDRPFVYVDDPSGQRLIELFILSSVHPLHDRDDTIGLGTWNIATTPGVTTFELRTRSSVWAEKVYRFRCEPQRFTYEIEVRGRGHLAEALFFGGYASASQRWGAGFFPSGQHFRRGFNPEPVSEETHEFTPTSSARIDLLGTSLPGKGDWYFTPPPFCFAFETAQGWIGMGIEAQPGANRWTEYTYHGGRGFHLSLAFEGYTAIDGAYTLPAIGFDFAPDPWAALQAHTAALRTAGYAPTPPDQIKPAWWYQPMYCGWGTQCALAARNGGRAPDYALQANYRAWLGTLAQHDIVPKTVVIDDKWQATYGDNAVDEARWPDLRGFIDQQHDQGAHVLLWLKAWDPEGVPIDQCITNAAGMPIAVDPSNPAYAERLRQSVRRMLHADGYNADGFKIDFTARIPSGPGMRLHGDVWGLELMKLYLGIIYDEAKHTKPDALVITHTPHPYLADVLDMIRLNDTLELGRLDDPESTLGRNIGAAMAQRQRVATIACPNAIIDTDNWPVRDREAWREYTRVQPELGVPALYFVDQIDRTGEPLEAEDYALIRTAWAHYSAQHTTRQHEEEL